MRRGYGSYGRISHTFGALIRNVFRYVWNELGRIRRMHGRIRAGVLAIHARAFVELAAWAIRVTSRGATIATVVATFRKIQIIVAKTIAHARVHVTAGPWRQRWIIGIDWCWFKIRRASQANINRVGLRVGIQTLECGEVAACTVDVRVEDTTLVATVTSVPSTRFSVSKRTTKTVTKLL